MAFYRSMESGLQMISNATHASDVEYDPTTSDLESNNLQDAILEINDKVNGIDQADQVHYDNTESGLEAAFVQDAIDELDTTVNSLEDGNGTPTFTSADVADGSATAWTSVAKLDSGETNKSILNKVSTMFKNIRFLYKMLGTTDISGIGNGTVTNAISTLNGNLIKDTVVNLPTYGYIFNVDNHNYVDYDWGNIQIIGNRIAILHFRLNGVASGEQNYFQVHSKLTPQNAVLVSGYTGNNAIYLNTNDIANGWFHTDGQTTQTIFINTVYYLADKYN